MHRTTYRALTLALAGTIFCGILLAQQTSTPPSNPPAGSTSTTTATPKSQTTAKPGTSTVKKAPVPLTLKTQKEKASYAIGMNIGAGMKKDGIDVSPEILLRGMKDAMAGAKPLLTEQETRTVLETLQADMRQHQKELHDAALAKNSKQGEEFLTANKSKPGVVALPSGLQYKVVTEGNGPKPTANDVIVCNYKGSLLDGTEFDSSYKRGQPATIPVGRVIKGWTEALQLMPVGSKWDLYIPSALAYGEQGTPNGGPIGPNETLVFEVELLSIQPKTEAKPAPPVMTSPDGQTRTPPSTPQPQQSTPPPSSNPAPDQNPPQTPPQAKPQ
jgi:FKBP-type peptidyl-prolyl cis-trans isomerase FklB